MKKITAGLFILSGVADYWSTVTCCGMDSEANPIVRYIWSHGGNISFFMFKIFATVLISYIAFQAYKRYQKNFVFYIPVILGIGAHFFAVTFNMAWIDWGLV